MSLVTEKLRFGYSRKATVLDDLSVEFGPGRTVLLGPNGAGKSTLLKVLSGLLKPWSGRVLFGGQVRSASFLRSQAGYMPQDISPLPGLTVSEAVEYAAWLGGLSGQAARRGASDAVEAVGLSGQREQKSTKLSGGQLRRLGLAFVLSQSPKVLLLDEPTAGLDPAQRHRFREVLTSLPRELTVVVSTHQVDDVEASYDEVRILAGGRLKWQGAPVDFLGLAGEHSVQQAEVAYLNLLGRE